MNFMIIMANVRITTINLSWMEIKKDVNLRNPDYGTKKIVNLPEELNNHRWVGTLYIDQYAYMTRSAHWRIDSSLAFLNVSDCGLNWSIFLS